jgi:DNA-directed RNA polymerase subunit D
MKIAAIEESGMALSFELRDCSPAYANAIRRSAMDNVATFAINTVTFYENSSAMFDEFIAHRMGLVPIKTPSKGYDSEDEVIFAVDETGPKTVYSRDFSTSDKDVKVSNENIPIIKLAESQRVRAEGKATLGTAAKHAKFQPGLITYNEEKGVHSFYVESFGQMPPKELINKALEAIREELKEVGKELKKL